MGEPIWQVVCLGTRPSSCGIGRLANAGLMVIRPADFLWLRCRDWNPILLCRSIDATLPETAYSPGNVGSVPLRHLYIRAGAAIAWTPARRPNSPWGLDRNDIPAGVRSDYLLRVLFCEAIAET